MTDELELFLPIFSVILITILKKKKLGNLIFNTMLANEQA